MAQIANQITLYKKMSIELSNIAGVKLSKPVFRYKYEQEEKKIELKEDYEGILTINEYEPMWSPSENNLEVNQVFSIENPSELFGENGITMPTNKIGIGAHLHSKTSNFQKTLNVGTIKNVKESVEIRFTHNFPISSLRGNLDIDFFIYLKENNENYFKHANKVGMRLSEGNISTIELVIDGDGSAFPMSEFEDKEGPLWKIEKNWVEAHIDTFDSSNVNLSLNTAHPLFKQIKIGKSPMSRAIMGDIMVQAMSMIIQEVILIERVSIEDTSDALPDSIAMAVGYWISTFEIDTSSIFSITNSLRSYWDRQMIEGDRGND